jgi:SPP1 gp7 family putative phage head morphogenesis protein
MSINDDVYSRMLKHRALLTLYEKRLDTEIDKILASHKIKLQRIVALSGTTNINVLTRRLNTEIRLTYKKIYKDGISELNKLSAVSARFYKSIFTKALNNIYKAKGVKDTLKVNDLIIRSNGTYSQQLASISILEQRKIKGIVKTGMTQNKAMINIAQDLGKSGLLVSTVQLKTLTRTAITETSNFISNTTYKLNDDVVQGYQYVATLDSRTSLICGRLDGKVYSLSNKNAPQPPQHFNCRSTTIPVIKSANQLLNTNNNRLQKRKIAGLSDSRRASINGQVPDKTTYPEWLSSQPNQVKLAVLGNQKRVTLFNSGKVKFSQFSNKDGKLISLKQLEELSN